VGDHRVQPVTITKRRERPDLRARGRPISVALVNMPWVTIDGPSIQVGLLTALARDAGHSAQGIYLNVELAAKIGPEAYERILRLPADRQHYFQEWLFSAAAFGYSEAAENAYCRDCDALPRILEHLGLSEGEVRGLHRDFYPALIDRWARDWPWGRFDVVGFTSTFEQNVPALALARAIKRESPRCVTLFGGANFDGCMGREYVRVLDQIDYAISGEADVAFPEFLDALRDGGDPLAVPGVISRRQLSGDRPRLVKLDALPVPTYDDYFDAVARHRESIGNRARSFVPMETARGCWWGQRKHCTFCGLNADSIQFRAKSPERALREVVELSNRHRTVSLHAVDNIIDREYLARLLPELAAQRWDIKLFYEVKANLVRDDLALFARAGVDHIQPGIESLSTNILRLMRKGSTQLINVRLLKWARYYGIQVAWNMLMGFPGEKIGDYEEQVELIPKLYHLGPPLDVGVIWLERFSPYFTESGFPIHDVRPRRVLASVYPVPGLQLTDIAYFFDYVADDVVTVQQREPLVEAVKEWQARWERDKPRPVLRYLRGPSWLTIGDGRTGERKSRTLDGWAADAYERCSETFRTASAVHGELMSRGGDAPSLEVLEGALDELVAEGYMIRGGSQYLALALPNNRHL
jgi:ribosomal peptide maturation radical SAM protein 1